VVAPPAGKGGTTARPPRPASGPLPGGAGASGGAGTGGVAAPPVASPAGKGGAGTPTAPPRATQTARFIAADPHALQVHLGADGKLPSLVLEDVDQAREEAVRQPRTSPPWLLLLVFGFSITASLALLFIDSGDAPHVERGSKTTARTALQHHYTGTYPPLAPYQQRIRRALQAYQKGDRAEEKRLYREVLDILHTEGKNKSTGVTGMIDAPDPPLGNPSDRHLEALISILLSD